MTIRTLALVTLVCSSALGAQETVISNVAAGRGFAGFSATPISRTAVLQSYMQAVDSGAVLGFALAIRGPQDWYDVPTRFCVIANDSLPPGVVGQWWEVGAYRYRVLYDVPRATLTLFDSTIDLRASRVVLVTLTADPLAPVQIGRGKPVALYMRRPDSFSTLFLPRAADVRAFAGLP